MLQPRQGSWSIGFTHVWQDVFCHT